jgi:hypothetical protein
VTCDRGLAEATLRIRHISREGGIEEELQKAFVKLFDFYGTGRFDVSEKMVYLGRWKKNTRTRPQVTVTGNAILEGRGERPTYSIFYGQDYTSDGRRSVVMSHVHQVFDLSDVRLLPTDFTVDDFEGAFNRIFAEGSNVSVHSLVSVVFLIRRTLNNFARDKRTEGRSHVMLY